MTIEHRRVAEDFDRIAEQYDTHAALQNELLLRALMYAGRYFPRRAKILDVGCGTGLFAAEAKKHHPDWAIHGVDIAFGMAKLARKHSPALVADVNALPYADAAFDSVFSGLCLQWVGDKPRAFREMARVIRPGGRAVMTCFGEQTLVELRVAMEKAKMPAGVLAMPGMEIYTSIARDAGWRVLAAQESLTTEYVARVEDLMRQIKRIGAANKSESRARHLSGVKRFGTMIATYEGLYSHPLGLPATWDVITLIFEKP
jgi:malonyl-CoA O-methyltransferase